MTPTRPISSRSQLQLRGSGCATVAMTLFGLVFLTIGVGTGWFVSGRPMTHALGARNWQPGRCQILTNQLDRSSDGDTSRIAVTYRYEVNGQAYTASRYDFGVGYDNFSKQAKSDFIEQNPPGKEIDCFIDPQHPAEAVIDRSMMKWTYGFGLLFGGMFSIPGLLLAGSAVFMRRRLAAEQKANAGLGVPGVSGAGMPGMATFTATDMGPTTFAPPKGSFGEMTFADTGPLVLKSADSPISKFLLLLVIFFFWNGLVGVFTWAVWGGVNGSTTGAKLFLIPFQFVGLLILWGLVYQTMALFNPRPTLTLGRPRARLGESLALKWSIGGGASRIGTLRIVLIGREEATYKQGTKTSTDKNEFHKVTVIESSERSRIEGGMVTLNIPANSMHTFTADRNKIVWTLQVTGEIRMWPDMDESFDITVTP